VDGLAEVLQLQRHNQSREAGDLKGHDLTPSDEYQDRQHEKPRRSSVKSVKISDAVIVKE
jgi:hypothetical protein